MAKFLKDFLRYSKKNKRAPCDERYSLLDYMRTWKFRPLHNVKTNTNHADIIEMQ